MMAVLASFTTYAIDASLFSFKNHVFTADASDLRGYNLQRQIYDDACDVGIAIRSPATGTVVKFYCEGVHRDRENEITHWTFKVTSDHSRDPSLANLSIVIFND